MEIVSSWSNTLVNNDFPGLVPEEYKDTKRVDLGIGINKLPADEPITIVYIGGIINSANTQELSD